MPLPAERTMVELKSSQQVLSKRATFALLEEDEKGKAHIIPGWRKIRSVWEIAIRKVRDLPIVTYTFHSYAVCLLTIQRV